MTNFNDVNPRFFLVHTQIKSNQSLSHFGHPIPTGLHYMLQKSKHDPYKSVFAKLTKVENYETGLERVRRDGECRLCPGVPVLN